MAKHTLKKESTLKKFLIFWEMKFFSPKPNNLLIFKKRILKIWKNKHKSLLKKK